MQECESWLARPPKDLLTKHVDLLPEAGLALDAASGVSANGLFLARRGLHVIALDISEYALRLAVERAREQELWLAAAVYDLSAPWLPPCRFDVILNFHFLERATLPVYASALKSGGLLFFESFVKIENVPENPVYYFDPGELKDYYSNYEIIYYQESHLPPGERHPERGLAQLVARKP
jgi:SAM-dependent methyltransferase